FRLGRARDVAHPFRVVEPDGELVSGGEGFEPHLGLRPAQWAGYAAQVELELRFFFASHWPTPGHYWYIPYRISRRATRHPYVDPRRHLRPPPRPARSPLPPRLRA